MTSAVTDDTPGLVFAAVLNGDASALEDALDDLELDGVSVDCFCLAHPEARGITPLLTAVTMSTTESVKIVEMLLERGASLEQRSASGNSALHFAVKTGSTACVEMVLQRAPKLVVEGNSAGDLPLMFALSSGQSSHIGVLLAKCDGDAAAAMQVRAANEGGTTALMIAATWQNDTLKMAMAKLERFVAYGADVAAVDSVGRSVLHYAAGACSAGWVMALLEHGVDARVRMRTGKRPTAADVARALAQKAAVAPSVSAEEKAQRQRLVNIFAAAEAHAMKKLEAQALRASELLIAEDEAAQAQKNAKAARKKKKKQMMMKKKKAAVQTMTAAAKKKSVAGTTPSGASTAAAETSKRSPSPSSVDPILSLNKSSSSSTPSEEDAAAAAKGWSEVATARRQKGSSRSPKPATGGEQRRKTRSTRAPKLKSRPDSPARPRGRAASGSAPRSASSALSAASVPPRGWTSQPKIAAGGGAPAAARKTPSSRASSSKKKPSIDRQAAAVAVAAVDEANASLMEHHPVLGALALDARHVCGAISRRDRSLSLSQIDALVEVHKQMLRDLYEARLAIEEEQQLVASRERRRIELEYAAIANAKARNH